MTEAQLHGKVALVTGATSGIGKITARELARRGAHVLLLGRNEQRTLETSRELQVDVPGASVTTVVVDLSVQAHVRSAARTVAQVERRLDILVNNAGAVNARRSETPEGIEMTWAVNHLAYFLLTRELLPLMLATPGARIVNVSSEAHRAARMNWEDLEGKLRYSAWHAYAQSKLANLLFTRELARRVRHAGVTVNAVHPGLVASGFGKNDRGASRLLWSALGPFSRSPAQGARGSVFLASSPAVAGVTGRYFIDERAVQPAAHALDDAAAERLWHVSEDMTR